MTTNGKANGKTNGKTRGMVAPKPRTTSIKKMDRRIAELEASNKLIISDLRKLNEGFSVEITKLTAQLAADRSAFSNQITDMRNKITSLELKMREDKIEAKEQAQKS